MTATDGGPALPDADPRNPENPANPANPADPAVLDRYHVPAGHTAQPRGRQLRIVLAVARVEALLLARSPLILAGLLAGGLVFWLGIGSTVPFWWNVGWRIGTGQLFLGMATLAAGQLAVGRARRNAMADLYASFPASAGIRTAAHLAGLAAAVPASLLLIAAAAAIAQARGAIGTPSVTVLAGGVLLVAASGAAGIAIGARFAHPMAGVLGALVLFVSSGQSHLPWPAGLWLYPWATFGDQLSQLPGPLAGYPPAGAHALELAGLCVLAGIVALAVTASHARARGWLAAAGTVALAVVCLAGALQLRPVPTADLNRLVNEVADPASAQRCMTASQVRYCLYSGFSNLLPSLETPVSAVLAHVPVRPAQPLTVRQVVYLTVPDATLTHGHPNRQVSRWDARVQAAPGYQGAAAASAIYLPVGSWPVGSGQLADVHFDLALSAATWAVRIPPQAIGTPSARVFLPCVPLDQAREAIAIWLAIVASHPPASELQSGLGISRNYPTAEVRNNFVRAWNYPMGGAVTMPGGGPQTTATGYLLAAAMAKLPAQRVGHVLAAEWSKWLNWHTTDAQLAAALGIRMPTVPRVNTALPPRQGGPQSPVCTT